METALSSAPQRKVLAACIRQARSVRDISEATGVPLATAYRQVNALLDMRLLFIERGAMTADGKPYDLYRCRVREAAIQVTADGSSVTWQPNAAIEERLLDMWQQMRWVA